MFQNAREINVPVIAKGSSKIETESAPSEEDQANYQNPKLPPETGKSSENPHKDKSHSVLHKMLAVGSVALAALALAVYHVSTKRDKIVKEANETKDRVKTKKQGEAARPSSKSAHPTGPSSPRVVEGR